MNNETTQRILEKIRQYDCIMIFRHRRPDGDCVGASKGLKRILQLSFPHKRVLIVDPEKSEYLAFLGADDAPVEDDVYRGALGIVVDTGSSGRISNPKYALCRELIKIDHHPDVDTYAALSWVEEKRSSACEMIAAFYAENRPELKMDREAATYVYTGMVTDSGRFRYAGVNGDTMRYAALLLDAGVDTQRLYAQLYLREYESFRFQSHVYETMRRTENGVAYLFVDCAAQEEFGLSFEEACTAIGYMDAICGCLCWLAFIEDGNGAIRVRLRSRFVEISALAEKYHGGGHAFASGATAADWDEARRLIAEADALVRDYKQSHTDWL